MWFAQIAQFLGPHLGPNPASCFNPTLFDFPTLHNPWLLGPAPVTGMGLSWEKKYAPFLVHDTNKARKEWWPKIGKWIKWKITGERQRYYARTEQDRGTQLAALWPGTVYLHSLTVENKHMRTTKLPTKQFLWAWKCYSALQNLKQLLRGILLW